MTPKEKAKELVDSFRKAIYHDVITTADYNPEREKRRDNIAKRCAMTHVDEILKIQLSGGSLMVYGMNYVHLNEYYSMVKKEIEKL